MTKADFIFFFFLSFQPLVMIYSNYKKFNIKKEFLIWPGIEKYLHDHEYEPSI